MLMLDFPCLQYLLAILWMFKTFFLPLSYAFIKIILNPSSSQYFDF